jgi:hypothetical protein
MVRVAVHFFIFLLLFLCLSNNQHEHFVGVVSMGVGGAWVERGEEENSCKPLGGVSTLKLHLMISVSQIRSNPGF